jgi:catechol 2,3-dioxygenase-like lactoylglutathione lyase family enzyme
VGRRVNITHLRHVAIATPMFERSRDFFVRAWGLRDAGTIGDVAYLRTQTDEPFQLALVPGPERHIDRIAFGLASRDAVDAAAEELARVGVPLLEPPHALRTPGGGYALRFADPDGRAIELSSDVARGDTDDARGTPAQLAHIVCNTPNLDRITAFYTSVLGLRVSDWSEHVMAFLRCNAEHHSIAFNAAPHSSYNHTSWTMGSIDELFRAQGRVRAWGSPLLWGTGRHGPGDQVFNYYIEPSGYVVEYIADGIVIEDEAAWTPQVWVRSPEFMDLWGTAGPPCAEIREAMAGVPDPGVAIPSP